MNTRRTYWLRLRYLIYLTLISLIIVPIVYTYADQQGRTAVTIDVNGTIYEVRTHATTVEGALQDANIFLDDADQVQPSLETPLSSNMEIKIIKANQLVIDIDGSIQRIYTHLLNPIQILEENNITVSDHDLLYVNHRPAIRNSNFDSFQPIRHIGVVSGKTYTIHESDTSPIEGISTARTVGEVLAEIGVEVFVADQISPPPATPLSAGLAIYIQRSMPVTIQVDGNTLQTRAVGETVEDILNFTGFPLSGQDYALPDAQTLFSPNMSIEIVRVYEFVERYQETIVFENILYPDPNLPIGTTQIVQEGQNGVQEYIVRVRRENGYIVSKTTQTPWIITPPITQIVAYGTETD